MCFMRALFPQSSAMRALCNSINSPGQDASRRPRAAVLSGLPLLIEDRLLLCLPKAPGDCLGRGTGAVQKVL
jgi:hypothetical protein